MPWPAIVLGLGVALAGASWTTDQAIMQNVLAAKSLEDARRAPLIGGLVKLAVPLVTVIPGLAAAVLMPDLDRPDTAIFQLILRYYPTGLAGLGFLSVMGAFTAMNCGMVTAISNIFTRNLYQRYIRPEASDAHYLRVSRIATLGALVCGVLTAFIAAQFSTVYLWVQEFNIFVIVPVFGVLLLGLFSRRVRALGAFAGLGSGVSLAVVLFFITGGDFLLWRAVTILASVLVITFLASSFAPPLTEEEARELLRPTGTESPIALAPPSWNTLALAGVLLAVLAALLIIFA